jgi:hypothetical protein
LTSTLIGDTLSILEYKSHAASFAVVARLRRRWGAR